jgi:hypothetical protein
MSKLTTSTQDFYIEIDKPFISLKELIEKRILTYFPKAKVAWKRLGSFEDWNLSMKAIPISCELVLLQSNFDHAYVAKEGKIFSVFANEVKRADRRSIGEVTHWPEALAEIAQPWHRNQKSRIEENYFERFTNNVVGTSLISKKLYEEMWTDDFTGGSKITRPDNPFGPSVKFSSAVHLTPRQELFRHLDGYSHVGIKSYWVKKLSPCCVIINNEVIHSDWIFCSKKDISRYSLKCDLPDEDELHKGLPINTLLKSISHRISYKIMRSLIPKYNGNKLQQNFRITLVLIKAQLFWLKIPRLILDLTIGRILVNTLLWKGKTARSNFILYRIMSNGWISLAKIDFLKQICFKILKD